MIKTENIIFNYLFYVILFLGFFLPSNTRFHISLIGIEFQIREIAFILLPIINLLCHSYNRVKISDRKLQYYIVTFILVIIVTEVLKHLYYSEGLGSAFKSIRIGLPLFSCLILLYHGIRANIERTWSVLLWAISTSAVLTLVSPILYLPIYPTLEGDDFIQATSGRFMNANASFGIVGIYLLYRDYDRWYNSGLLPKITAILSIVVLTMTFNRTYLAILCLALIYLTFSSFSIKHTLKYVSIPLIAIGAFYFTYTHSDIVQHQVDNRIMSIVYGHTDFVASVYEDNRDAIYEGIIDNVQQGYWSFGLPYSQKIFYLNRFDGVYGASKTDISFINILLRYGVIPLILLFMIYGTMYMRGSPLFRYTLTIYIIVSLNIDSLLAHNSVLFLTIVLFVVYYKKI